MGDTLLRLKNHGQTFAHAYNVRGRELLVEVGLGTLAQRLDYRHYGGASLLGLNGNIIIAHGRSQSTAIKNAIGLAKRAAEKDVWQKIKEAYNGNSRHVEDSTFDSKVIKAKKPVLVDFWANGVSLVRWSHRLLTNWPKNMTGGSNS